MARFYRAVCHGTGRLLRGEDSNPYSRDQNPLSYQLNDPGWSCPPASTSPITVAALAKTSIAR